MPNWFRKCAIHFYFFDETLFSGVKGGSLFYLKLIPASTLQPDIWQLKNPAFVSEFLVTPRQKGIKKVKPGEYSVAKHLS